MLKFLPMQPPNLNHHPSSQPRSSPALPTARLHGSAAFATSIQMATHKQALSHQNIYLAQAGEQWSGRCLRAGLHQPAAPVLKISHHLPKITRAPSKFGTWRACEPKCTEPPRPLYVENFKYFFHAGKVLQEPFPSSLEGALRSSWIDSRLKVCPFSLVLVVVNVFCRGYIRVHRGIYYGMLG